MMKRVHKPGYDECLEWDGGTTVHCTSYLPGTLAEGSGMNVNINSPVSGCGRLTLPLEFRNKTEVDAFCAFLQEYAAEMCG